MPGGHIRADEIISTEPLTSAREGAGGSIFLSFRDLNLGLETKLETWFDGRKEKPVFLEACRAGLLMMDQERQLYRCVRCTVGL